MREAFNKDMTDETDLELKSAIILSMITRLRQLADHPFLAELALKKWLTEDDTEALLSATHDVEGLNHRAERKTYFLHLREALAENAGSYKDTSSIDENSTELGSCSLSKRPKYKPDDTDIGRGHGMFEVCSILAKSVG